jgi:hypothetical protein
LSVLFVHRPIIHRLHTAFEDKNIWKAMDKEDDYIKELYNSEQLLYKRTG